MKRSLTLFITSIIFSLEICTAQSVGVVMNGGGAKGLYHIGVLEALEESGVPIDCVAGTSIGAIISGLYAAGYSPAEMREIALSGELERWTNGKIERNLGAYVRRGSTLYKENPTLSFRLDPKTTINPDSITRMPKSLISTTQIDLAMNELFTPATVACEGDFSKLMIPFLCVASNVTNDTGVIMTEGDLGKSIRASMAIPLAFKPIVNEDGHILYDGGIYDNFPWRPMSEHFSPDFIIGSVCGYDSWANTKNLSIMDQAFLLAMNPSDYNITQNSVIIDRDIQNGMLDFSRSEEIINLGYKDTMESIDEILSNIEPDMVKTSDFYNERRKEFRDRCPQLIFDSYQSSGLNDFQKRYTQAFMTTSKREQRLGAEDQHEMSFQEVRKNLFRILSENEFTTNYPQISYDASSERYQFCIEMENKPALRVGLSGNLSSTQFNQLYIGVNYKSIKKVVQDIFGELYLGPAYITGRIGHRADFYMHTPMFIDTYVNFSVKNLYHGSYGQITEITNSLGIKHSEQHLSVGIGVPIEQNSLALLRTNIGSTNYRYDNGLPTDLSQQEQIGLFYKTQLNYVASKFEVERSTINNAHYPTDGSLITLSAIGVTGLEKSSAKSEESESSQDNLFKSNRSWFGLKAAITKYYNAKNRRNITIGVSAEAVYTNVPDMSSYYGTLLFMPTYSPIAHTNMVYMPEYSAPRYVAAGVMPSVKLWNNIYLQTNFYAMLRDSYDETTYKVSSDNELCVKYISQGSFIYETGLGPASLSITKYNINNWDNLYITFNFGYSIFAPKGTFY